MPLTLYKESAVGSDRCGLLLVLAEPYFYLAHAPFISHILMPTVVGILFSRRLPTKVSHRYVHADMTDQIDPNFL